MWSFQTWGYLTAASAGPTPPAVNATERLSFRTLAPFLAGRRPSGSWWPQTVAAKWQADLQYIDAGSVDDFAVQQPDHALLATWVFAGLRNTGPCYDLSAGMATSVLQMATASIRGSRHRCQPRYLRSSVGGPSARLIGKDDLPAAPAVLPEDDNVRTAFVGLVEHVLLLQGLPEPWPEMMCMSANWRGYGIADGMRPEETNAGYALRRLRDEAQPSMEQGQYTVLHPVLRAVQPVSAGCLAHRR